MRLFDILRSIDPSFPACHAFVADAIAEQIDSTDTAPDFECWPREAYGNIAPPYRMFFVEARTHARDLNIPGLDDITVERGVLFRDATGDQLVEQDKHLIPCQARPEGTRWIWACYGFVRFNNDGNPLVFPGHGYIHIGTDGRLLDDPANGISMVEYPEQALIPGAEYCPLPLLSTFLPFALFAVKALHDRCVVEHIKPTRQQRRHAQRKDNITLQEHYILKVTTPTPQRRYPPRSKQQPVFKRQHSVRGHFRFYTEEAPLFGRIAGAVWVPSHQRGNAGSGAIEKDYQIAPRSHEE